MSAKSGEKRLIVLKYIFFTGKEELLGDGTEIENMLTEGELCFLPGVCGAAALKYSGKFFSGAEKSSWPVDSWGLKTFGKCRDASHTQSGAKLLALTEKRRHRKR